MRYLEKNIYLTLSIITPCVPRYQRLRSRHSKMSASAISWITCRQFTTNPQKL